MMFAFAYEYPTFYQVIITDGTDENSYTYEYTKEQNIDVSIYEATLLANEEKARKEFIPTPI